VGTHELDASLGEAAKVRGNALAAGIKRGGLHAVGYEEEEVWTGTHGTPLYAMRRFGARNPPPVCSWA
jgi:hypothetical protein